jgi:hypothetical protein
MASIEEEEMEVNENSSERSKGFDDDPSDDDPFDSDDDEEMDFFGDGVTIISQQ